MLRWRLFGINFCIEPSFWLMNALWAYMLYSPLIGQGAGARGQLFTRELLMLIGIWILCMLVTVMVHELGHVITGRIFGQPGNITVTGLGGQAVGEYGALSPWKRILVIAAGPGAGFLFVAFLVAFDGKYWNFCMDWLEAKLNMPFWDNLKCRWFLVNWIDPTRQRQESIIYELVLLLLFILNLITNIMNLLPIIPMDGGMIFKEICGIIAPKHGVRFAFGVSFVLATMLTLYLLVVVLVEYRFITKPFELYYPFAFPEISVFIFGMMAFQCYRAYRQLGQMQRHSEYAQDDD